MTAVRTCFAVALTLTAILWITFTNFLPQYSFGLAGRLYIEQYAAALLTIALVIVYVGFDLRGTPRDRGARVPLADLIVAAVVFVLGCHFTVAFPAVSQSVARMSTPNLVVGCILILAVIEGMRRTSGPGITIVVLAFFALALLGHLLPQEIAGRHLTAMRYAYFLAWDSSAVLGIASQVIATTVVAFVLFGAMLFTTGGGRFFTDLSMTAMGRFRGGQGKIAVLASSLFGSISGSVVANVVTTGVLTIPLMKSAGFKPKSAAAIEAVSSTGGQLLPPLMGIAAFILAEFLSMSYADVALAALVPAVLFYIAIFIQVDLIAVKGGLKGLPRAEVPRLGEVLRSGWFYTLPFVILVAGLFGWNYPPESAALLACLVLLPLTALSCDPAHRFGLRKALDVMVETGMTMAPMVLIGAGAGMVIATLNYTGIGFGLSLALVKLAGGHLLVLLVLVAVVSIILGMGLPTVGVYVLLATLVAPALVELGVDPLAAHLFILYFGCLSMITPPVAIGVFAAANIAKAPPMASGWEAVRIGWMIFVIPFLFVTSDTLLLRGTAVAIGLDFCATVLGIWLVSAGMAGVMMGRIPVLLRGGSILSGALLLLPARSLPFSAVLNVVGLVLAVVVIAWAIKCRNSDRSLDATEI